MKELIKPIVILGAARSGTKVLPRVLRHHPDVAFWGEPNYVWKYRNAHLGHDMIPPSRATEPIIAYIRSRFSTYARGEGKTRFCEKTPANTLRLPFVLKVMPDAKVVHIIRDGRDVALSARERWLGSGSRFEAQVRPGDTADYKSVQRLVKRRLKNRDVPLRDLPYYLPGFLSNYLNRVGLKKREIFGPRFPGIKDVNKSFSLIEVCALQWLWCVETVLNCVTQYEGRFDYYEVKYEDLCTSPARYLPELFDFLELSRPDDIQDLIEQVQGGNVAKWKQKMTDEELERVNTLIGYALRKLGYEVGATVL